mgnify:CR=1 FL=1
MGKPTGFMEYSRQDRTYAPAADRITHFNEFVIPLSDEDLAIQGARCMDCGIPFCHSGCPLGNLIPDFNDAVYNNHWERASKILHATNNFPEFTGRLCPAPCEEACVLGINEDPVSIENIEKNIVETAFAKGWIRAEPPAQRTGKKVAVVGSGPAGLAAAHQQGRPEARGPAVAHHPGHRGHHPPRRLARQRRPGLPCPGEYGTAVKGF